MGPPRWKRSEKREEGEEGFVVDDVEGAKAEEKGKRKPDRAEREYDHPGQPAVVDVFVVVGPKSGRETEASASALANEASPPSPAYSCLSLRKAPRVERKGSSRVSWVKVWEREDFTEGPAELRMLYVQAMSSVHLVQSPGEGGNAAEEAEKSSTHLRLAPGAISPTCLNTASYPTSCTPYGLSPRTRVINPFVPSQQLA